MKLPNQPLVLPKLPYSFDALEPIISEEAMRTHYFGHHKGYVDKYNTLLAEGGSQEDKEFNFGGHILHSLYWANLEPIGRKPNKLMQQIICERYPSTKFFFQKIVDEASKIKGSGWLILNKDLEMLTIPNHDLSLLNHAPVLVIDSWEHAWYLQYKNKKQDFFNNLINIINWDKVLNRLLSDGR